MTRRVTPALVALALVVGTALLAGPGAAAPATTATGTDGSVAPGARLAGVVGVGGAEIGGEMEPRSFAAAVEAAETDDARAAAVARQVDRAGVRLDRLDERRSRLVAARANGSIGRDRYRAETARLAAESRSLERVLNRTGAVSGRLPPAALAERGVDSGRIDRLRADAANLTGPEVARIAREIAGPGVGAGPAADGRGPPDGTPARDGGPGRNGTATGGDGTGPPADGERGPSDDRGPPERDNETAARGADEREETDGGDRDDEDGDDGDGHAAGDGADDDGGGDRTRP